MDKLIKQYFNVLDLESFFPLHRKIKNSPWWFDHRTEKGKAMFFSQHIKTNNIFEKEFLLLCFKVLNLIQSDFKDVLLPLNMKVNGQVYGQNGAFHKDYEYDGFYTFVFFPVDSWDTSWGGELVVHDGESYRYFPVIPNTGVLFNSNFEHVGFAPNRNCNDIRISVAINFLDSKHKKNIDYYNPPLTIINL